MSQPVSFEIHTTYELPVSYSKTGLPCIWESGGGYTSRGDVVLVGGINGERLRPLYIRTRGSLACKDHALFVIQKDYTVVRCDRHRSDYRIWVGRIVGWDDVYAQIRVDAEYDQGEWDHEPTEPAMIEMVEIAKKKSGIYHCRTPMYYKDGE